ncbi:hypothetical protein [Paraliomyxa miuraensis]|uniref:hypothetical protein n=1 Tax=Paraliomyxa miuraensis TaxID=376150 RepID=UPI002251053A|nr:hypothetical protein [Paraliomyxa miuraensis]MCX4244503.1 hypothetical protein [Paraliomyxa miuraensis]
MPAEIITGLLLGLLAAAPAGRGRAAAQPWEGDVEPGGAGVALMPGEVELTGEQWRALQPEPEREPEVMLLRREVWLRAVEGGVEVRARWTLRSERPEWFGHGIVGSGAHLRRATWNGREATVWAATMGGPMVVERVDGNGTLEAEAFVPGDPRAGLTVSLLGAPQGMVHLEGFSDDVILIGDELPVVAHGGGLSTGSAGLELRAKVPEPRDRGPLVVASVGLGLTVGDAEVTGRARVRWEIRQGSRESLSLSVAGVGEDLTVEGAQVASWRREGGQVLVELGAETTGLVDLDLRWTVAAPAGAEATVAMPSIVPQHVFRSPCAMQVARDGEVDVRPELSRGWRAVPSALVPAWAEGLVEGTPTAAFVRSRVVEGGGDSLSLLRLEPVPGPPVVVDVADLRVAVTEEGRMLMRVRYELRNERASHLLLTPPPGMELLGVEVAGRRVRPGRAEGGGLWIPLKRSLETIEGLVTVPVTVALIGRGEAAWARRERRELPLPVVDAPVNVQRITLHLPPRYRNRVQAGDGAVVDGFDRGEEVGYGLWDPQQVARADRVFSEAVEAWNANEFERAQALLDQLGMLGAGGAANVRGLQANVELVRPREPEEPEPAPESATVYHFEDDDIDGQTYFEDELADYDRASISAAPAKKAQSSALERRIRARARARSSDKKASFEGRKQKAKKLKAEGNYEAAAAEYREALEESKELRRLEDEESVEYDFEAEALEDELADIEARTSNDAPEPSEAVEDVVDEAGEKDLVSAMVGGVWAAVLGDEDGGEPDDGAVAAVSTGPVAAPWGIGVLVVVPEVGEAVLYQHLLLEAGEQRSIRVDARRGWRR